MNNYPPLTHEELARLEKDCNDAAADTTEGRTLRIFDNKKGLQNFLMGHQITEETYHRLLSLLSQ